MANLDNIPLDKLSHEHYRQMLVRVGQRSYDEWHSEFLRHQQAFFEDQDKRMREQEARHNEINEFNKRRTHEAKQEFRGYQDKYLEETRRY